MIVNWMDYVARQERYLDHLHQAEKRRLIDQATGGRRESALWQAIKAWALGISQESLWGRGLAYQRR